MKEGSSYRLKQVTNILSGLEGWSSADAALEGIKRRCCVTAETDREFKRCIVEGNTCLSFASECVCWFNLDV